MALEHLAKGQISKAVARLTSHGVADTRDLTVMAGLRSKYVARGREMPATVTLGQPVDRVAGLKDTLLNLGTGSSPGTGGMRGEFLTCLAEVWQDGDMARLEDFSMLYLTGALPAWFYKVWGSVTTVPLFKTRERLTTRCQIKVLFECGKTSFFKSKKKTFLFYKIIPKWYYWVCGERILQKNHPITCFR